MESQSVLQGLPAWVQRLAALRRKAWFAPASRWTNRVFTGLILAALVWKLNQLGWLRIWNSMPVGVTFYALVLVSYFVQPLGEKAVYRLLWRTPLPLRVFLRKRVLSSTVFSYSGEPYLFFWARRHVGLPERTLLHGIKDSNLLSASAGLLVLFLLAGCLAFAGDWRLPALQEHGWIYWSALAFPLLPVVGFVFARRHMTLLSGSQIAQVFLIHFTRNLVSQLIQIALFMTAIPGPPLAAWVNFLVARLLIGQISFMPSSSLFQLTAGIGLAGVLGLPDTKISAVLLVGGAVFQLLHFAVMAIRVPESEKPPSAA